MQAHQAVLGLRPAPLASPLDQTSKSSS
jgi:hypothetical protein